MDYLLIFTVIKKKHIIYNINNILFNRRKYNKINIFRILFRVLNYSNSLDVFEKENVFNICF